MPFPISFSEIFGQGATVEGYARQLKALLPRGQVWKLETDSWLSKTLLALATELHSIDARGEVLIRESNPATAEETIGDWERLLGLPDDLVTTIPATLAGRQLACSQKYTTLGGQSNAYFVRLALACGYTVTVSNYVDSLLRVGFRVLDRVYGDEYAYAMLVTVTATAATALTNAEFERVIRHATHSHIQVVFAY